MFTATFTVLLPVPSENPPEMVFVLKAMLVTFAPIVTENVTGVDPVTGTVTPPEFVTVAVPPEGVTVGVSVTCPWKFAFGEMVTT